MRSLGAKIYEVRSKSSGELIEARCLLMAVILSILSTTTIKDGWLVASPSFSSLQLQERTPPKVSCSPGTRVPNRMLPATVYTPAPRAAFTPK